MKEINTSLLTETIDEKPPKVIENIHTALLACDFGVIENDSRNEHFKNSYASLPKILSVVKPILKKNGILLYTYSEQNTPDVIKINLVHVLSATSVFTYVKLLNMTDMQKWGGCITFGSRRGLLCLLGISPDDDKEDGNNTINHNKNTTKSSNGDLSLEQQNILNQQKIELKKLWELKSDAAFAADQEKAFRVQHNIVSDFINVSHNQQLSIVKSIQTWLKTL